MNAPPLLLEGIVLRLIDYGESDRIVGLLTRDRGKISAFAPSARVSAKRFGGALDFFHHLRVELRPPRDPQGSLWRLSRVEPLETHLELRRELRRLAQAGYLADCLWNLLGEGDPHPEVYDWFGGVLARLSEEPPGRMPDLRFELEMLALCGFAPHWDRCLECGAEPGGEQVFFSFHRGGILCRGCRKSGEGRWIDGRSIGRLRAGEELTPDVARSMRQLLNSFVSHTIGREPKSQRFREEVLRG